MWTLGLRSTSVWLGVALLAALVAACSPGGSPPAATPGAGDPNRGKQIIEQVAQPPCGTCHTIPGIPGAVGTVGPDLAGVATRASQRVPGESAEQYLRESLVNPNAYVVPGFPSPSPMPSYEALGSQQINDVVAFLLTLR